MTAVLKKDMAKVIDKNKLSPDPDPNIYVILGKV